MRTYPAGVSTVCAFVSHSLGLKLPRKFTINSFMAVSFAMNPWIPSAWSFPNERMILAESMFGQLLARQTLLAAFLTLKSVSSSQYAATAYCPNNLAEGASNAFPALCASIVVDGSTWAV